MSEKNFEKVRDLAKRIVDINQPYYSKDFFGQIPDELMGKELVDSNLHETAMAIDKLRFQKEEKLLQLLGIPSPKFKLSKSETQELADVISNKERHGELSPEQQQKVKEIKFLSNLAQTVLHH